MLKRVPAFLQKAMGKLDYRDGWVLKSTCCTVLGTGIGIPVPT